MSKLALFLLGPPRIEHDGTLVDVDTRKAVALLAYLAVTRQRHSRDTLAALLWPDYDQSHARATLRRTLSTLNKALNGNWLDIERETISVNRSSNLVLDVERFNNYLAECKTHGHSSFEVCSSCQKPLTESVALYRDDFMAGFSLRDSPNFDDWQFFQADSLRHELASALERLVYCHAAQADFDPAIAYARRWLALDRLHEPAHRYLMQLYAWSGQRGPAIHQYRECVQVLEQELGVAPLEATTQLYQAIKENHVPAPPVRTGGPLRSPLPYDEAGQRQGSPLQASGPLPAVTTSVSMQVPMLSAGYPLMGRSEEWEKLKRIYASIDSTGHMIILEGEAGIGKTRLAEEFLAYGRTKGASIIAARCYEGETHLAYEPIVAGLRTTIAQRDNAHWLDNISPPWLSETARLLPELTILRPGVPAPPPLDGPGAQSRFFEGLRQVLLAACSDGSGGPPGIIFIDDIQWADGASLDLLSYLVRRLSEQPLCLVVTWRTKQAANDSHLHHLFAEAQRSGKATVLSLSRLDQSTVKALVQSAITTNQPPSKELIERLYQETEGLPFFLVEYLTAIAKGVLKAGNENWSLPGGVRDLLHSRLVAVDEVGWQLLNAAAVIGRSFDFDALREISGRSEEETVTALEELIAQGLVAEMREGAGERALNYDFCHEKLRSFVYEETSLARRRLLHRRVAEVLSARMRGFRETGVLFGQIAYHYRMAGNEAAAAEYYRLAGEHARALYANTEALSHFHLALALSHPETAALHEALGDLHTLLGEYSAALKSYETAASLCEPEALPVLEHKLGNVYERRGEWELAELHLDSALHALGEGGSKAERARVYSDWSLTAYHLGKIDLALKLAHQALQLAEDTSDIRALAQAHNMLGVLASSQGDTQGAHYHLEHSLALAESLNDPSVRAAALNNLALAYGANGEVDRAIALAEFALALCVSQGDRHREAALHNNLADLLHSAGQAEAAISHLKQAVSIYAEIGVEAGSVQPEIWKLVEW